MKPNEAYCVRCHKPRRMYHPVEKTLSHGRLSLIDKCSVCGATMSRLKESDVRDPDELEVPKRRHKKHIKRDILGLEYPFRMHYPIRRDLKCRVCGELYSTFLPLKRDCGRCAPCYGARRETSARKGR